MNALFPPDGLTLAHVAAYAVLSFILTVIVTRYLIGWLKARQFGKAIRVDGPDHAAKAGTPTMGGMGMLAVIGGLGLVLAYQASQSEETSTGALLLILTAMAGFAVLGLWDDLAGLARKSGKRELGVGLTARRMLVLQVLLACGLAFVAVNLQSFDHLWPEKLLFTFPVIVIGIVSTVNGVNFSDGLDGLASGLLAIAFGYMGLLAFLFTYQTDPFWAFDEVLPLIVLSFVIVAACLGFLVFNRHPARVFMGNVTSMGLGAALALWSLVALPGTWLLLPIIGIVFVAEVVSDIVQIGYFKWTGGKRFFRMAPLHHHFEKGGMSETQVVHRFWATGLIAGLVAISLSYLVPRLFSMFIPSP